MDTQCTVSRPEHLKHQRSPSVRSSPLTFLNTVVRTVFVRDPDVAVFPPLLYLDTPIPSRVRLPTSFVPGKSVPPSLSGKAPTSVYRCTGLPRRRWSTPPASEVSTPRTVPVVRESFPDDSEHSPETAEICPLLELGYHMTHLLEPVPHLPYTQSPDLSPSIHLGERCDIRPYPPKPNLSSRPLSFVLSFSRPSLTLGSLYFHFYLPLSLPPELLDAKDETCSTPCRPLVQTPILNPRSKRV